MLLVQKLIEPERIRRLNENPVRSGKYILYWMDAAQRASWNQALEFALALGHELRRPVLVVFALPPRLPPMNLRHYSFVLGGLRETAEALHERGILFLLQIGDPPHVVSPLAHEAAAVVTDRGYLEHQRTWRKQLAERVPCAFFQVETEAVVPVDVAYPKEAINAGVLRRRILPSLPYFLRPPVELEPQRNSFAVDLAHRPEIPWEQVLANLPLDRSVPPVDLAPGTKAARRRLRQFVEEKLGRYHIDRHDPTKEGTSGLSPYLHFGQISPGEAAWRAAAASGPGAAAFLEELVVRRELALNFVVRNPRYSAFAGLPSWAQETLRRHAQDPRPHTYALEELERGETHDPLWNAAQAELRKAGKIHGYMRMYWGKQFILWLRDPEEAFRFALYLNNKYALDGGDPASYAGVGWCFGLHDRPFPERPIFGKVRPMTGAGLRRKFEVQIYISRWNPGGTV